MMIPFASPVAIRLRRFRRALQKVPRQHCRKSLQLERRRQRRRHQLLLDTLSVAGLYIVTM